MVERLVAEGRGQLLLRIEPLDATHHRALFTCGVDALDNYLRWQASQDIERRVTAAFVLTDDSKVVRGFYTLSNFSLLGAELPEKLARRLPSRTPIGATLLGRMAVSLELKRKGFGEKLLLHALQRAWLASQQVASWAVIVDAKDEARNFYLRYDFEPLPSQPNRLFLTMKTISKLFNKR